MWKSLMMWALVNVSRHGFGRPQGPTDLCVEQPLNVLQERLMMEVFISSQDKKYISYVTIFE